MKLPLYIACRYLFSKKSHNAVNIISYISICGIAVATMAMVCTLSVFNGFEQMVVKTFNSFDPDLKISVVKGKVFSKSDKKIRKVEALDGIKAVTYTLEENALLRYGSSQAPIKLKGVDSQFTEVAHVDPLMIDGSFVLQRGDIPYAIMGVLLASHLQAHHSFITPLEIFAPVRGAKINLANPSRAFTQATAYLSGVISLNNAKEDESLMISSLETAQKVFQYSPDQVSSMEVAVDASSASILSKQKQIQAILGDGFVVKNRYQQQESMFKMLQIEKWVTFFILVFIVIIAIFNVVGAHTMLIIEKQQDIVTLQSLGASKNLIAKIFLIEGWLVSALGAFVGLLLGVALSLIQQYFGVIKLEQVTQVSIAEAYPVVVQAVDVLLVLASVLLIGLLAVIYPVRTLRKQLDQA